MTLPDDLQAAREKVAALEARLACSRPGDAPCAMPDSEPCLAHFRLAAERDLRAEREKVAALEAHITQTARERQGAYQEACERIAALEAALLGVIDARDSGHDGATDECDLCNKIQDAKRLLAHVTPQLREKQ